MNPTAPRRARFLSQMEEGVAIFSTSSELIRNADSHHRFRPDSDFYFLTGFAEPDAVMVLAPQHPTHRYILFVRPRDEAREVWNGRRAGIEGAVSQFGADIAYPIEELEARLPTYLEGARQLYYRLGIYPDRDRQVIQALHTLRHAKRRLTPSPTTIVDASVLLHEQRLYKEPGELELMRRAASISGAAHRAAMAFTRPGRTEYEVEALLEHFFRHHGALGPAYPSIVGSGENATVLHYVENHAPLRDGEMLLVDAGAEFRYYAADITRTYPVNGRFTSHQRAVYEIVLTAQLAAIDQVRPGVPYIRAHETVLRVLTEGLVELGLLKGSIDELLETEAYRPYYMHGTSHWLGLDVHDAGDYVREGAHRSLEPGMVLTVEPGLYFGDGLPEAAQPFRGIGIRIEDDVLVTPDGHDVLTHETPKTIEALEALVGQADGLPRLR